MQQSNLQHLESKISILIDKVESAGSWKRPFQSVMSTGLPKNYISDKVYKGVNIFFLWMESIEKGYLSNQWLTMKQCNSLKGKILKGQKASTIFFFKPIEVEELDESTGEITSKIIPMLKNYRVFNLEQTTLKPDDIETTPINPLDYCEEFFASIDICDIQLGNSPFYACKQDYISMPPINKFIDANSYYATLAHELIHSTGHSSRLGRDMDNNKESYAYEELIAELGSCFLSAHLGIDADDIQDNATAYLKSWLKSLKNNHKYLYKAMSEASKAYEYLIDISNNSIKAA